ncbi:hypothetical protein AM506_05160 [Rossellomorea vietnamensis]|uniref:Uncharacterized protein n=1 Tax=Rossellomorea vietnamensis TaxID=218284 RepID=A0A0P6WIQ8_9BACI|nr:hypothetical protein AM506_05160 [Rossellomorea vietnamensis]
MTSKMELWGGGVGEWCEVIVGNWELVANRTGRLGLRKGVSVEFRISQRNVHSPLFLKLTKKRMPHHKASSHSIKA